MGHSRGTTQGRHYNPHGVDTCAMSTTLVRYACALGMGRWPRGGCVGGFSQGVCGTAGILRLHIRRPTHGLTYSHLGLLTLGQAWQPPTVAFSDATIFGCPNRSQTTPPWLQLAPVSRAFSPTATDYHNGRSSRPRRPRTRSATLAASTLGKTPTPSLLRARMLSIRAMKPFHHSPGEITMPRIDTLSGSDALGTFVDLQQFPASTVVHEIPAHAIHTVHLTLVNESNALIAFTFREANNLTIATTFFVPRQGKLDLGPLALRGPASWLVSVDKNPDHARIGGLVDVVYSK